MVPQEDNLDLELSVADNLFVYGRYFGIRRPVLRRRIAELLEFARLCERAGDKVDNLSGGMKRRLTIARSLVNDPSCSCWTSPPPASTPRPATWSGTACTASSSEGVTQVLTTHYMDEAERLCDRLVIMDRGKIVARGLAPPADRAAMSPARWWSCGWPRGKLPPWRRRWQAWRSGWRPWPAASCSIPTTVTPPPSTCLAEGLRPLSVLVRRTSLEDVFLRLTGRHLTD